MKRVMIIGSAGSGKSTLAQIIGTRLGLPVFHMDRDVYWLPDWQERDKADQIRQIERLVANDSWVFEGSNSKTFALREARADYLVWLDFPLWLRLWRVSRRAYLQRGQTRTDMAEGCVEKLSMLPEFWLFNLRTARSSRQKQLSFFEACRLPKQRLRRLSEVNAFIAEFAP